MIRLAKPYIPKEAYDLVKSVLDSGNLIQGNYVELFEKLVGEYLQVPYVKMVSSGTAALHLALMALNIRSGDEVLVPAFTFPATANVVEVMGATPVFVDINLSDFCINDFLIEERITPKTKAIIPVHEFGQSANMEPIFQLAQKHNLSIIEDAACALGSEYHNQKVGTLGDIGCFSLHPRKAITTGEGGIVVTSNKELAEQIDLLRNHGLKKIDGSQDFIRAGLNYRMTEFQAAVGIPQLQGIKGIINQRIDQASLYAKLLTNVSKIDTPNSFYDRKHIYQTYHVLIVDGDRDSLIHKLKKHEIETNLGAQALNCLTYYRKKYGFSDDDYPNATKAFKQGLALPIGMHLTKREIEMVTSKLKYFC